MNGKTVPFKRPGITLFDKTNKEAAFTDIASPSIHSLQPQLQKNKANIRTWRLKSSNSGN
jgi:hypothetical protein